MRETMDQLLGRGNFVSAPSTKNSEHAPAIAPNLGAGIFFTYSSQSYPHRSSRIIVRRIERLSNQVNAAPAQCPTHLQPIEMVPNRNMVTHVLTVCAPPEQTPERDLMNLPEGPTNESTLTHEMLGCGEKENGRPGSRMSDASDGSTVVTERAGSESRSPPPTLTSSPWSSSPPPTRATPAFCTRAGGTSELRLRNMQAKRRQFAVSLSDWKRAPPGTVQLAAHRSAMVQFVDGLREDFGLGTQVTTVAVSLMDRYLCSVASKGGCPLKRAELTAMACLMLACKFREMQTPSVSQLLDTTSTRYRQEHLKDVEVRRDPGAPLIDLQTLTDGPLWLCVRSLRC